MEATVLCASIRALLDQYATELTPPPPPPPEFVVVYPSDNIAAAFATGLPVHLVEGQTYGAITVPSGGRLVGNGALVQGFAQPALFVAPGSTNIEISDLALTSNVDTVVRLGENSSTTQGTLAQVPTNIILRNLVVPIHRGKRAFEVHAANVTLDGCSAFDVHTTTGADSQGIWIHNTPGPVTVIGGIFEAGSENILVGGDTIKIPGNVPSDLTFNGVTLRKPLAWKTDGVNRAVKNLFELKAGRRVRLLNASLDGCWVGVGAWALVFTPKNANIVEDVLVQDCTVRNVGGLVQLMGLDYNTVTPAATRGIVLRRVNFTISKALYGGTGGVTTLTGGMKDVTFDACSGTFDGSQIVFSDSTAVYGQQGPVTITGCTMPTGQYGIKADGVNYGDPLLAGSVYVGQELLVGAITGNTFTGAPAHFRTNFPANTYGA